MKIQLKTSLILAFVVLLASSCGQTTTSNTKKTKSATNPITGPGPGTNPSDPTNPETPPIANCDGVQRSGAMRCYYKNIPKIILSGSTSTNLSIWSSTSLPSTFSPMNLQTDGSFSLRIKPSYASGMGRSNPLSTYQNRACADPMAYNFKRLKVFFMLRRKNTSIASIYETTAAVDTYSTNLDLPVLAGTNSEYILEIMGVLSDHRCQTAYGSLSPQQQAQCDSGNFWDGIPIVAKNAQGGGGDAKTSCIGLNIEFATDTTTGLP